MERVRGRWPLDDGAAGGTQMKTITIRLPDLEAAMLAELQRKDSSFKSIEKRLIMDICNAYSAAGLGASLR